MMRTCQCLIGWCNQRQQPATTAQNAKRFLLRLAPDGIKDQIKIRKRLREIIVAIINHLICPQCPGNINAITRRRGNHPRPNRTGKLDGKAANPASPGMD